MSTVVFGGTFDPITQGHVRAIRTLSESFTTVIIALTSQNPWKSRPATGFRLRLHMIRETLNYEKIKLGQSYSDPGICLSDYGYVYAKDFVLHLQAKSITEVHWAVGSDCAADVKNWKDWSALNIPIYVIQRTEESSSKVRQGAEAPHPAIIATIAQHKLYR
ncbi:adenylyltransferase/cytidyltransferase family protein [bacterium]|nr:adenylyltransferase/cytidyltransferase family protein [bacterium]